LHSLDVDGAAGVEENNRADSVDLGGRDNRCDY